MVRQRAQNDTRRSLPAPENPVYEEMNYDEVQVQAQPPDQEPHELMH